MKINWNIFRTANHWWLIKLNSFKTLLSLYKPKMTSTKQDQNVTSLSSWSCTTSSNPWWTSSIKRSILLWCRSNSNENWLFSTFNVLVHRVCVSGDWLRRHSWSSASLDPDVTSYCLWIPNWALLSALLFFTQICIPGINITTPVHLSKSKKFPNQKFKRLKAA